MIELLDELLCFAAELFRDLDFEEDVQIAAVSAVEVREALLLGGDDCARLSAGGIVDNDLRFVWEDDSLFAAERSFGEANFAARPDVETIAFEIRIALQGDVDVQIAGFGAGLSGHTLAGHAQTLSAVDTSGERDEHFFALFDVALTVTVVTRLTDDATLPAASGAGRAEHDEAALRRRLPRAVAIGAGFRLGAFLGACAATGLTGRSAADLHLFFHPFHCLTESERGTHARILTALRPPRTTASSEAASSEAAKEIGEHVLEMGEDVAHSRAVEIESAARSCMTEAIVFGALIRVGEDRVRLRRLLELRLGVGIVFVPIRMILEG